MKKKKRYELNTQDGAVILSICLSYIYSSFVNDFIQMFLQQLAHLLNSKMFVAAYRNSPLAYRNLEIMQNMSWEGCPILTNRLHWC